MVLVYIITIFIIIISIIYISKNRYNSKTKKILFTYIINQTALKNLTNHIITSKIKHLGIDLEYNRGEKYLGEICLIQITLENHETYIIDPIEIGKNYIKNFLEVILIDKDITKIFHACYNDIEWIKNEFGILTTNIFDTQEAEQYVNNHKTNLGLDEILKKYELAFIDKAYKKSFQKSDWKKRPLTSDQLYYSAQDSYYLIELYDIFKNKLNEKYDTYMKSLNEKFQMKLLRSIEKRHEAKALNYINSKIVNTNPLFVELKKNTFVEIFTFIENKAINIDRNPELLMRKKTMFKIANKLPENKENLLKIIKAEENSFSKHLENEDFDEILKIISKAHLPENKENADTTQVPKKTRKRNSRNQACKGQVYDNCKMLAPDDEMLCYSNRKKMDWYINRGLATLVSENPPIFKLKIEPKSRAVKDRKGKDLFMIEYDNLCVICGKNSDFSRFHIVPLIYKQHLPVNLRSHSSYGTVLLCTPCQQTAFKCYEVKKKELSDKYDIPLIILDDNNQTLNKICYTAKNLLKNYKTLPNERKSEFSENIKKFLTNSENKENFKHFFTYLYGEDFDKEVLINEELLSKINQYKSIENERKRNLHGKRIVEQLSDFSAFIDEWIDYFINNLKPKYLSEAWNKISIQK